MSDAPSRSDSSLARDATRRDFLRSAALGGGLLATGLGLDARATPALAADAPAVRRGKSFLKLSLAAYSFSRVLPRSGTPEQIAAAKMTLDDFIDYCAELDLDGTELTGYFFPKEITPEYLNHVKHKTFRLGLDVSGTAVGNDFAWPDGPEREKQLAHVRHWIEHAAAMGAPVVRIFAGNQKKGDDEAVTLQRIVAGIEASLEHAAKHGVFLAIENHGDGLTASGERLLALLKAVRPSPWFGINLDTGNFRTPDPYRDMALAAPHAVNVQVKATLVVDGAKQPADLPRIVDILRQANYRGYVVLEYEESEDPRTAIPPLIERLRQAIRA